MFDLIFTLAMLVIPFAILPLLWRRMKKTRDAAYQRKREKPVEITWEESSARPDGLNLSRPYRPNDALIDLGSAARESRWPIDNG